MMRERSAAILKSLPETHVYPVLMLCLLLGTSVALSVGLNWVGIVGVVLLAIMSLAYGAVQTADDIP